MTEKMPSASESYGREEAYFVYMWARSLDGSSAVPDKPIEELARDAVRTSLRVYLEDGSEPPTIDVEAAVRALSERLEIEALGNVTFF